MISYILNDLLIWVDSNLWVQSWHFTQSPAIAALQTIQTNFERLPGDTTSGYPTAARQKPTRKATMYITNILTEVKTSFIINGRSQTDMKYAIYIYLTVFSGKHELLLHHYLQLNAYFHQQDVDGAKLVLVKQHLHFSFFS